MRRALPSASDQALHRNRIGNGAHRLIDLRPETDQLTMLRHLAAVLRILNAVVRQIWRFHHREHIGHPNLCGGTCQLRFLAQVAQSAPQQRLSPAVAHSVQPAPETAVHNGYWSRFSSGSSSILPIGRPASVDNHPKMICYSYYKRTAILCQSSFGSLPAGNEGTFMI